MSELSDATAALTRLATAYGLTRDEMVGILSGPVDGGNGDGYYEVTTPAGTKKLVPSIDKIADMSVTPTALAAGTGAAMVGLLPPGALAQVTTLAERFSQDRVFITDKMTPDQRAAYKAGQDTYAAANWASAQACINEAKDRGGGTVVLPYKGPLWVDQPIEGESYVAIEGVSRACTIRKKGSAKSNTTNVDCIINVFGKREFSICRLTLIGDRRKVNGVDTGTQHGLHTQGSYDAVLSEVTIDYCLNGFQFSVGNNIVGLNLMAIRCSGYAFRLFSSQTTTTLLSPVAWGCAGGYSLETAPYNTIIASAADLISVGNRPGNLGGDPFGDAGGDYLHPLFIFQLIGARGTNIISPGTEGSCAQYLYAEGDQCTIIGPYIDNLQAHTPDWIFAQLRGPNSANVKILTPSWREAVLDVHGNGPRGFVVETPEAQQFAVEGRWRLDAFAKSDAYSGRGMVAAGSRRAITLDQTSMIPGVNAPFLKPAVEDIAVVIVEGGLKKLQVKAVSTAIVDFVLPLPREGMFNVNVLASYTTVSSGAQLHLVSREVGGMETIIRTWSNDGNRVVVSEWVYAAAPTGGRLFFRIRTNATSDELKFEQLEIDCSPRHQ